MSEALRLGMELLGEKDPRTIAYLNNSALVLDDLGRADEALPIIRRVHALQKETHGEAHPSTITSLANLASILASLGRSEEAEPILREVLALRTKILGLKDPSTLRTMGNLAVILDATGRSEEAEALHRQAVAVSIEVWGEKHPETISRLSNLAGNLIGLERASEAEPLYRQVLEISRELYGERHAETVSAYLTLTYTLLDQPDRAALALEPARAFAAGGRELLRVFGATPAAEAQLGREMIEQRGSYNLLANAAWAAAQANPADLGMLRREAFEALQRFMLTAAGRAVSLSAAREAARSKSIELGELARERQSLAEAWLEGERAQSTLLTRGDEAQADRVLLTAEQTRIAARMMQIDERLRSEAPDYHALLWPEPLDEEAARALLAPDEVALLIVPTGYGTHLLAVSRDGLEWARSPMTREQVEQAVLRLRHDLDPAGTLRGAERVSRRPSPTVRSFDRQTAYRLYRELIAPLASSLEGKRNVYIAVEGPLSSLPFGVLVTEEPSGSDTDAAALRATSWFADSHALVQLPSLQSLQFLRSFRKERKDDLREPFAGFGDPLIGTAEASGLAADATEKDPGEPSRREGEQLADPSKLRRLARLPGTAFEVERMRQVLGAAPSAVHLGGQATESAVRGLDLSRTRVIAFATHGLLADELDEGMEPGLVFTPPAYVTPDDDGLLTASEIAALKLDAEWVILSACNTAAGDGDGAGLSGLARAFFYSGARTLLASHWQVRDDVAAELTPDAVKRQQDNPALSRAQALQAAMRAIRDTPGDPTRAHPSAWAPFSLIGDAG